MSDRRLMRVLRVCVALLLLASLPQAARSADEDQDIVVHVEKHGETITVDVDCPVDAPAKVAWAVLTDYDRMPQFMSKLESSNVLLRDGNLLRVQQKGSASRGLLTFRFENVREIELVPDREIRSRLISGDLKSSEFTTRLMPQGRIVHILNSGSYVPNIWVPPLIGPALIAEETRKHFAEIRAEILRRSAL